MNTVKKLIAVVGFVGLSGLALGVGDSVDTTKNAEPEGFVSINVVRGSIRVQTWDESAVSVEGTLDERLKEFIFEVDGDETYIEVKLLDDHGDSWGRGEGSDLTIQVPLLSQLEVRGVSIDVDAQGMRSDVEIGVVSGDVSLEGGDGRVSVQSVSGDVEVKDSVGRLSIGSVSGDVETLNTSGDAEYTSVSGSVSVENGGDNITVETVSGDIEVVNNVLTAMEGQSVSGDIEVLTEKSHAGSIEFDTVSGDIELVFKGEINARFDIETGTGTIENNLSDDDPRRSRFVRDETLRFTQGDGEGSVVLSSRSGDITLGRD